MAANSPAADHSQDFEELAGLQALYALEGEELARFEEHAARCERCRLIVRLDRETLSNLSLAAPEMEPSPDFKARLMQRAAEELAQRPAAIQEPIPLRPRSNVVPFWKRQAWASAIAAVFVLGLVTLGGVQYMNQAIATYTLSGDAPGHATVTVRRSGAVELHMEGVPDPPSGSVYEAWIIPPGQQPVPAGVLANTSERLPLDGSARGSTVAITLERGPGGSPTPTLPILMAGNVAL